MRGGVARGNITAKKEIIKKNKVAGKDGWTSIVWGAEKGRWKAAKRAGECVEHSEKGSTEMKMKARY